MVERDDGIPSVVVAVEVDNKTKENKGLFPVSGWFESNFFLQRKVARGPRL